MWHIYCYWQTNFINLISLSLAREFFSFAYLWNLIWIGVASMVNKKMSIWKKEMKKEIQIISIKKLWQKTNTHTIGCYETKIWLSLWIVIIAQIFFFFNGLCHFLLLVVRVMRAVGHCNNMNAKKIAQRWSVWLIMQVKSNKSQYDVFFGSYTALCVFYGQ